MLELAVELDPGLPARRCRVAHEVVIEKAADGAMKKMSEISRAVEDDLLARSVRRA